MKILLVPIARSVALAAALAAAGSAAAQTPAPAPAPARTTSSLTDHLNGALPATARPQASPPATPAATPAARPATAPVAAPIAARPTAARPASPAPTAAPPAAPAARATTPAAAAVAPAVPAGQAAAPPAAPPPPTMTVLDRAAIAALPFTVSLPAGFQITTGRPGPDFRIYTVRRGEQSFVTVYAGPASQFPIYDGELIEAGGRASIVYAEDGVRHAMEHLFQRSTAPAEIHIWVSSLDGADRALAEQIAQSVDTRP